MVSVEDDTDEDAPTSTSSEREKPKNLNSDFGFDWTISDPDYNDFDPIVDFTEL